ncbi:uncharacterized protein LOC124281679 isoform X2 [Haliotis rubra]|uniref:uncharacterized protein LOC124281679 isoform X2 n=1 Tax=Haliotis rubra TaxID=36100 RepID=UPI001EE5323F|nr:uncharacterized protein LOC124281679 isoform X2 [Haliotis rubra]
MCADVVRKRSMRRLMFDQDELNKNPVENVSAVPLDEDMFEWHCNIKQDDIIYHLLLFFPNNYPYDSPSAEFVPSGFQYNSGATKPGKRGTKICLNIFSDFADIHTEWADQKALGWSPGYTVQTVLMNVISFLAETQASDWAWMKEANSHNLKLSKSFTCKECGHTYKKPYPSLETKPAAKAPKVKDDGKPEIVDYISKDRFKVAKPKSQNDLYGYGLVVSGPPSRPSLTTPCEFLTGESYCGMLKSMGKVQSVMKEDLKYFLPLYIHPLHGNEIQPTFEATMKELAQLLLSCKRKTVAEMVLKVIPNLMSATVVEFSKGTQHTSENSLNGYFALHRLLLWAMEIYTELQDIVEERLKVFIDSETNRTKRACPHIGEWLLLLTASSKYRWSDAAHAYLSESFKRNVMWYVKDDAQLGYVDTDMDYRLTNTLTRTAVSRKLLAFQVLFLDIAMPAGKSRKELLKRYDENHGFPSPDMVKQMKGAVQQINDMNTYDDWYKLLKLKPPTKKELFDRLVKAVKFSIQTDGYKWTFWKTAGGWNQVLKRYPGGKIPGEPDPPKKEPKGKGKKAEEEEVKKPTGRGKGKGPAKGKAAAVEEDEEEEEEEEEVKKPKGRGKGKGPAKGKAVVKGKKGKKVEESEPEEEEMEVVKPARGRGRGVKRTAEEAKVGGRGRGGAKKRR